MGTGARRVQDAPWGPSRLAAGVFEAVVRELTEDERVSTKKDDHYRRGQSPSAELSPELRSQIEAVTRELAAGGAKPPSPKELQQTAWECPAGEVPWST